MRIEIADPKQVIYIGQRGENEATQVVFQKSYFAGFDGGTYELLAQRKAVGFDHHAVSLLFAVIINVHEGYKTLQDLASANGYCDI